MRYLLDTTVIIDYLNGRDHVIERVMNLAQQGYVLGCCCVNITEVYAGLKEKERKIAEKLIDSLKYFEVTKEVAKLAGEYRYSYARKGKALATADVIVAACASNYKATLITANIDHYLMDKLSLEELPTHRI